MTGTIDYAVAGPLTTMNPGHKAALDQIPNDPVVSAILLATS